MPRFRLLPRLAATLCVACLLAPSPARAETVTVAETWISAEQAGEEMDSLAVWPRPDGTSWLIATAKDGQRLLVFDADSGARIGAHGGPGDGPGQFRRPNGIAVAGDLLFVVDRDGGRVQVLRLPGFEPLGQFGQDQLLTPYGIWLDTRQAGAVTAHVTDSFMADFRTMTLPPMAELAGRVKRFQVRIEDGGKLETRLLGQFGDTGAAGALRMVESIAGDPAHGRLLIAEEDRRVGSTLRDYSLAGHYTGRSLATFDADAEGIALWACSAEDGYWVAVDQLTPTRFRVFDRATLAPAGVFSGKVTSNTDGETVYAMPTPRFPAGALFALHNDVSLAAFDLRDIARALDLKGDCPR